MLAEPAGAAGLGSDGALVEQLVMLSTDIDDLDGESLAAVADGLRTAGALDVVLLPALMKKGRPGTRLEVLGTMRQADALERWLLVQSEHARCPTHDRRASRPAAAGAAGGRARPRRARQGGDAAGCAGIAPNPSSTTWRAWRQQRVNRTAP